MPLSLTDRQAKTVAAAVTILSVVVILVAIGAFFWLVSWFLRSFSIVFLPLAVGGVAALVCRPYYDWLRRSLRLPGAVALVAIFLSVLIPVSAFLWFFGAIAVEQLVGLVEQLPDWWVQIQEFVRDRWPRVVGFFQNNPWGQRIREALAGQEENVLEGLQVFGQGAITAGRGLVRGVGTLFGWAVLPVYFAFFLMTPSRFDATQLLPFLKEETRKDVVYLIKEFVDIVVAFFRGQLLIAFLQGLLFAIGFTIAGLKYGFILGLMLGLLNIIPYLGSIIGLSITLPLSFFQPGGGLQTLIGVVVVYVVVQLIEGYILTPRIMGDRTGLPAIAIIVAIFFWGTALGGILGMILAIPLTAFLASLWRLVKDKYVTELV